MVDAAVFKELATVIAPLGTFPVYNPDFLVNASAQQRTLISHSEFLTYCLTTTDLLNYAGLSGKYANPDSMNRADSTDAYKCVPFDPDNTIVDGKISVDMTTGIPLTNIAKQRNAIQDGLKTSFKWMTDWNLERHVSTGIGIAFVVLLIFGTVLGVLSYFYGKKEEGVGPYPATYTAEGYAYPKGQVQGQDLPEKMKQTSFYIILGVGLSLFGFLIGYAVFSKGDSGAAATTE